MEDETIRMILAVGLTILALASVVSLLFLLRKYRQVGKRNYVVRLGDIATQVLFPARCPKCGMMMESGFVLAGNGLHWRKDSDPARRKTPFTRAMPNTVNAGTRMLENKAWHCPRCRLLLIDYNYQIIPEERAGGEGVDRG